METYKLLKCSDNLFIRLQIHLRIILIIVNVCSFTIDPLSLHVGKISQSATVRSLEANTVAAHYRQELTQCKLLGLHVQIERELFNTIVVHRRNGTISRRSLLHVHKSPVRLVQQSRSRKYNRWADLILWILLAISRIYNGKDRIESCTYIPLSSI